MLQNLTEEVHRKTHPDSTLPWIGAIGLAIAVGIPYFLEAHLSLALLAEPDGVAVFWPAAGVSSGVLIALGRDARLPVSGGAMVATVIANLMGDRNAWSATAFALCNAGEALLAAWLIERYFGSNFSLDRLRNVLGLVAAAVVATAASGIGGTVAYKLFHSPTVPISTIWQHWFASDAVGIITVAPLVIGLAESLREPPPRKEIIEGVLALVALAVITITIVLLPPEPWQTMLPVALLFPILLWLAAHCRPVFAAAASFIVSLTIVWTITFGIGHFRDPGLPIEVALCANVLAALFAERRRSEARLQEALTAGSVTAFEWDLHRGLSQRSENAAQILGLGPQQTFSAAQFLARVHPDDRAHFKAHVHRVRVDSPSYSVTFRFMRPDGREVWLEETSRGEFDTTVDTAINRSLPFQLGRPSMASFQHPVDRRPANAERLGDIRGTDALRLHLALLGHVYRSLPFAGGACQAVQSYFAVGNSSECVKDWVEKKIRRHMARARNSKGFGWKRWNTQWLYESLRRFNGYKVRWLMPKVAPAR